MENFTNETIDTNQLPRFEEVTFTALHQKYLTVVILNLVKIIAILILVPSLLSFFRPELFSRRLWIVIGAVLPLLFIWIATFSIVGYKRKGFAFREHDVLYRSGIIATNTVVIPYNRVQHVALHEGVISRYLGLANVEIFTAGGSSSDLEIPGIDKEQAEKIKQLLMGKIQKQL
jgi:membrane protein YdbS with pleckstrin-like domain